MKMSFLWAVIFILLFLFAFPYLYKIIYPNSVEEQAIQKSDKLNLLVWESYLDPSVIHQFEEGYDVDVEITEFSTIDQQIELFEKDPSAYDVIIIDDGTFADMDKDDFESLDKASIPNFADVKEDYKNLNFDPGNKYTVPLLTGTTGIVANQRYVYPLPDSWDVFWDEKYKGKTAFLDDKREVLSIALKRLGYSLNTENKEELDKAKQELLKQKADTLDLLDLRSKLISEDIYLGVMYSGDAYYANSLNENIVYIVPKEGTTLWVDSLAIPKSSKNKKDAYKLINFLLEPEISAALTEFTLYASSSTKADAYISEDILNDSSIYPSQEILDKCEYFEELTEEISTIYEDIYNSYKLSITEDKGITKITGALSVDSEKPNLRSR